MATTDLNMSMGAGGGIKQVSNVMKQRVVLDRQATSSEDKRKKKKKKHKNPFDTEDKIEISGDGRRESAEDTQQPSSGAKESAAEKQTNPRLNIVV